MRQLQLALASLVYALAAASAAQAQPTPDTLRAAPLTVAQLSERDRRLTALEGQFRALASETSLHQIAIRNLATEVFGAQPNLPFATYVALVEQGARELHRVLEQATRDIPTDPEISSLRTQAVSAAERGQLTEARSLYARLLVRSQELADLSVADADRERLAHAGLLGEAAGFAWASADFLSAADLYARASSHAPTTAREHWWYKVVEGQARLLHGNQLMDLVSLREAERVLRVEALPLAPRQTRAFDWAYTMHQLGEAQHSLYERSNPPALAEATESFRAALEVYSHARTPREWAKSQVRLGVTLRSLGINGDRQALQEALQALSAALTVYNPADTPQEWASAQNARGATLDRMAADSRSQSQAQDAVSALQSALTVRTRESSPYLWAQTQRNLGSALQTLGNNMESPSQRIILLQEAAMNYRSALQVYTRADYPHDWASATVSHSNVLTSIGQQAATGGAGLVLLREALSGFLEAAEVMNKDNAPSYWGIIQHSIGTVQRSLGTRGDGPNGGLDALHASIQAFNASLEVRTLAETPRHWAASQHGLGATYRALFQRGERQYRRPALEALRAALAAYEQLNDPYWAEQVRDLIADM